MRKTITTVSDLVTDNEYRKKDCQRYLEQKATIDALGFNCLLEYDNDLDNFVLFLSQAKTHKIYKQEYSGQWSVWSTKTFPTINYDGEKRLANTLTPPNNFKVPTLKIISAWVAYSDQLDALKQALALEGAEKHGHFLAKLDEFSKKPNWKLWMSSDGTNHGWLTYEPHGDKGGSINLEFSLEANGYISQNIRLSGVYTLDDLATFLA